MYKKKLLLSMICPIIIVTTVSCSLLEENAESKTTTDIRSERVIKQDTKNINTENRSLKILEPITEINSEEDVFPIIPQGDEYKNISDLNREYTINKSNTINKILTCKDTSKETSINFVLPNEIDKITNLYTSHYRKNKVYINATNKSNTNTNYYEIDVVDETIKRYNTISDLKDIFKLKWTFKGDLRNNVMLDNVDNVILTYGDDGVYAGCHDHEYLYGLDKETGEKLWSVYGGYLGVRYCFNKSKDNIILYIPIKSKLQCLDIYTGRIIWEKELKNSQSYDITSVNNEIVLGHLQRDEVNYYEIESLDQKSGEILWIKKLNEKNKLQTSNSSIPLILCKEDNANLIAYNSKTGDEQWRTTFAYAKKNNIGNRHNTNFILTPYDYSIDKVNISSQWFSFDWGFTNINIDSGEILDSITLDQDTNLHVLSTNYTLINNKSTNKPSSFSLYDNISKKMMWSKNENLNSAILDNDKLYYTTQGAIKCVDIISGEVLWDNSFPKIFNEASVNNPIQPVIINNDLFVIYNNIIFIVNNKTGELVSQIGDYYTQSVPFWKIGYLDAKNYYLTINKLTNNLYIGRQNGYLDLLIIE